MRFVLACLTVPVVLAAAPLTQGERDRAMSELHATRKLFLDSIAGLSGEQWNFKPGPNRWSVAEVAEHIAVSEQSLFEFVTGKVMKTPPVPTSPEARAQDERLLKALVDRSDRATAPPLLRPSARWNSQQALLADFTKDRDRTIAFVETTPEDLRGHSVPHPVFQSLDAYQWILLIAGHSHRHILQIREVKADPRFPRR
jgi:hypothetical protein